MWPGKEGQGEGKGGILGASQSLTHILNLQAARPNLSNCAVLYFFQSHLTNLLSVSVFVMCSSVRGTG